MSGKFASIGPQAKQIYIQRCHTPRNGNGCPDHIGTFGAA